MDVDPPCKSSVSSIAGLYEPIGDEYVKAREARMVRHSDMWVIVRVQICGIRRECCCSETTDGSMTFDCDAGSKSQSFQIAVFAKWSMEGAKSAEIASIYELQPEVEGTKRLQHHSMPKCIHHIYSAAFFLGIPCRILA